MWCRRAAGLVGGEGFAVVMGRFVEDQILDHLVKRLNASGLSRLRLQFVHTKKKWYPSGEGRLAELGRWA